MPDIVWVKLPGGRFPIGGDEQAYDSLPAGEVELAALWMAKYPITNRQFQAFIEAADGYHQGEWWQGLAQPKWEPVEPRFPYGNHPREGVNWYEAVAFCRWLSARLGYEVRLPREQEWERAARGEEGRFFPWGPEYISGYANIDETGGNVGHYYLRQTSAVGIYPQGATPEGVEELAGNVWEWTLTEWESGRSDELTSPAARVLRGGSWNVNLVVARCGSRDGHFPGLSYFYFGFRLVSPVGAGS
ncbi:MAG TPA: hypothetical protein DEP84_36210 [Chloroflexi bacterium]|nr:hypothetical protein [Chloroflexota bacterium]